jgi:Fe-S-cluster containining protein
MGDFPCTGCSLCCKNLKNIYSSALGYPRGSFVRIAAETFPFNWDLSGACVNLVDGKCSVYEGRPLLCNVKALSTLWADQEGCEVADIYALTAENCNQLIDAAGLSPEFKINPELFK